MFFIVSGDRQRFRIRKPLPVSVVDLFVRLAFVLRVPRLFRPPPFRLIALTLRSLGSEALQPYLFGRTAPAHARRVSGTSVQIYELFPEPPSYRLVFSRLHGISEKRTMLAHECR